MSVQLRLITGPIIEPVVLTDAKAFLVLDPGFTQDDGLITALIVAARQYAENYCNRSFYNQTWQLTKDWFPFFIGDSTLPATGQGEGYWTWSYYWNGVMFRVPKPSLVSVTSITYLDTTGTVQTVNPASYFADTHSEPGRIVPAAGSFWPWAASYFPGGVQIIYVSGTYGDGAEVDTCPETIRVAIKLLVGHWYSNREASSAYSLTSIPMGVSALLDSVKFTYWSWGNN
jgi:uncharacterized phiE125 gp8 family phage protein